MIHRFAAAFTVAFLVSISVFGCASDDEDNGATETATSANGATDTGTRTLGEGIENLQDAQAQICPELSGLETDLEEVSISGTEAGADVIEGFASIATGLDTAAAALTSAGAEEAATAAEDLASSLESLSTSSGEEARALAGEAADGVQQLTSALQCP